MGENAGGKGSTMNDRHDNDITAKHTPGPSGPQAPWQAAGAQQSRRLTERLGICLRRSSVYRRETARDLAQLCVAILAALAAMIIVGRLFLGAN